MKEFLIAGAALLFLLWLPSADAQIDVGPTVHELQIRQQRELQLREQRERALRRQQEAEPKVHLKTDGQTDDSGRYPAAVQRYPVDETPCFKILHIGLQGDHAADFSDALKAVTEGSGTALGHCLGTAGINIVLMRVQNVIVAKGYVTTRIVAAPQDLNTGNLILTVLPGRVHAVRFAADADSRGTAWNAMPIRGGDLLNLRDIEQGLENLKRVPSAEADVQIEPAHADDDGLNGLNGIDDILAGQSDLLIRYQQRMPFRLNLSFDDGGSSATGKYQGGLTFSYDNWWTLNDLFYFSMNRDLGGGEPSEYGIVLRCMGLQERWLAV